MRPEPTNRRTVRALAGLAAAALLTTTAACGGSDDPGSSSSPSSSSSSGSSSGAPSSSAAAAPLTKADFGQRTAAAFEKAGTFRFTLTGQTSGQNTSGKGESDITGSKPATSATVEAVGQQIQVITVGGVFYIKAQALGTGGKFLKVTPGSSSSGLLQQLGSSADPSQLLKVLGKARTVTATGRDEVDGTETTTYKVVLPTSAISSAIGAPESLLKELPDTLTYLVDVDDNDLVRRQQSTLTVRGVQTKSTITFGDFGADVSVSAPPASQVTTKPALGGIGG